jgi:hypothetical protein
MISLLKEWNIKTKLILRTGSRVLIFHFRFKTSEKKLYEAVEIVISKFCQSLPKAGAYVQYFLDIVLERDVRNQAGIADFLNFWDKTQRNSVFRHRRK